MVCMAFRGNKRSSLRTCCFHETSLFLWVSVKAWEIDSERQRERDRARHRDGETERERQRDRERERQRETQRERHSETDTAREKERHSEREMTGVKIRESAAGKQESVLQTAMQSKASSSAVNSTGKGKLYTFVNT